MVEILVQFFAIKFVRNLGLNDRCMHRLITRRRRSLAGEKNRCSGSCLRNPIIYGGVVGHQGSCFSISLRQQEPFFPQF